ncbi:MAG: hypothetical protein HC906_13690 [Bacteroidales bacterium]|nr:hypothetical protein [Bacteroidales bacterium]
MIIPRDLPQSVGMGNDKSTNVNAGNIRNVGNDLLVNYKGNIGDVKFNITGNFMYNTHEILNLEDGIITKGGMEQFVSQEGGKMSSYYGYEVLGLYQVSDTSRIIDYLVKKGLPDRNKYDSRRFTGPGDLMYDDVNNDTIIDLDDRVYLGDPWPEFSYGINLGFEYKGIDFSMFFQGVNGNQIYNISRRYQENAYGDFSFTTKIKESWTPENTNTDQPRVIYGDPNKKPYHIKFIFC